MPYIKWLLFETVIFNFINLCETSHGRHMDQKLKRLKTV